MATAFSKDTSAKLDYKFAWIALTNASGPSDWLEAGETIPSHTVTAATGLTVDSSALTNSDTSVTVWLSGGTVNTYYDVVCHIVTSAGREDDRTIRVRAVQR